MGLADEHQLASLMGIGQALMVVLQTVLSVIFAVFGVLASLVSALPIILIAIVITAAMLPWVVYHDNIIEQAELAIRGTIYPIWRDHIREIASLLRDIYNPAICWWNALNWWGYGMVREVLWPTIRECGVRPLIGSAATFLKAVAVDILLYLAQGRFLYEDADFSRVSPAGIAFFQSWLNLSSCACGDLSDVLFVIPIVSPLLAIAPAWPVIFFSGQWLDPKWWCAIEYAFNAVMAAAREIIRLVTQIINLLGGITPPGTPFIRPDIRDVVSRICPLLECFIRSMENAIQVIWDRYIPFKFVFTEYLCILDVGVCFALKTLALVVRILINVDRVVVYPADLFWEDVIKPDMIEILNLAVAPTQWEPIRVPRGTAPLRYTMINYYYDTASENTPIGRANPVFGKRRFVDCACTFIQRTICDPSDPNTGCYSQGAQNLLMGLDFCCLTNNILKLAADLITGLIEFSMHLGNGPDDFFLFVDIQPFTTVLRNDLVSLAHCIFSFFGLIPVVGTCIRDLLVGLIRLALSLIDFGMRALVGLLTLPYYIYALEGVNNFVMEANLAVDFFIAIHDEIIADVPSSIKNCLCAILNNGFPIPPVPCPSCIVSGFVQPAAFKKRSNEIQVMYDRKTGKLHSPMDMMRQVWGIPPEAANGAAYAMTPMIRYFNHTTNPIELYHRIRENAKTAKASDMPFPNMDDLNTFIDKKRDQIYDRYIRERKCHAQSDEEARVSAENPKLYAFRKASGYYKQCNVNAPMTPMYEQPSNIIEEHTFVRDQQNGTWNKRLILGETQPPTIGCSNPVPPCFDLCCVVRSLLELLVHTIKLLARFFNGMIQGSASTQGTVQDFPYFTGEFENFGKATFEADFVMMILKIFKPIQCACQVLNLIIPVTDVNEFTNGREDICCFVQRVSEFIACLIQVIIQAISALAMGGTTNYIYFKDTNMFMKDAITLFDIVLAIVQCLCVLARAIFPLNYIPGFREVTNFDICCLAQALLVTVTEALRTVTQIVLSIALIGIETNEGGSSAFCFWRLDRTASHNCGGTLDGIGIIKQLDVVIDSFFPRHGELDGQCLKNCGSDNGATGIVPCLCQIFNTLIPFRPFPGKVTNCEVKGSPTQNCPLLDFCCPFAKLGFAIGDALKFINRAGAALWQSWDGGLPEFFTNYIWCDEGRIPPCAGINNIQKPDACSLQKFVKVPRCQGTYALTDFNSTVVMACGAFTCGKFNIVIDDLTNPNEGLLAKCLCQIFSLLDYLLAYIFSLIRIAFPFAGWSCCFCGGFDNNGFCNVNKVDPCFSQYVPQSMLNYGSSGVLPALSYVITAVLKAVTRLIRAFPLYCYWNPNYDERGNVEAPDTIRETWIFSFLGPTASAICIATGNMICFAQSMFFLPRNCLSRGEKFAGGISRWSFEVVFRVIGFIEAFIQSFLNAPVVCVGPTCDQKEGSKEQTAQLGSGPSSVNAKPLGNMLVILLSIPIDLLIGDADIACTTVCPPRVGTVPTPDPCDCWNMSPRYANNFAAQAYKWNTTGCIADYKRTLDGVSVTQKHVGLEFGDTSGCCIVSPPIPEFAFRNPMPICQNIEEVSTSALHYPGSCAVLAACRPDSLPSCANDPETPPNLSANYRGALDGIVMGIVRYLRCMLDNLFGCNAMGFNCAKLGTIFYPAVLVLSIVWQLLGGFIRFQVSLILFVMSLFNPPSGNGCECWNSATPHGLGPSVTRYWRRVSALCYKCIALDNNCDAPTLFQGVGNDGCSYFLKKCKPWCPVWHRQANASMTAAQAHAECLLRYAESSATYPYIQYNPRDPGLNIGITPEIICSGIKPIVTTLWEVEHGRNSEPLKNRTWGTFNTTTSVTGWCFPPSIWSGSPDLWIGNTQWEHFFLPDVCPAPACQDPSVTRPLCGVDAYGMWPCGRDAKLETSFFSNSSPFPNPLPSGFSSVLAIGSVQRMFDCNYNAEPLVTCGAIQVISNMLDVFKAFVEIFTTPLLIPSKRDNVAGDTMRQMIRSYGGEYKQSGMTIQNFKRNFQGVIVGLDAGGPNFAETVTAAIFDYDTSDCYDDPMTCHCRNLDMPSHCQVDPVTRRVVFGPQGRKRDGSGGNMTVPDLTMVMKEEMFIGTSVCDMVISEVAGKEWGNLTESIRNQYVKCLDRYIQGTRLNHVNDAIPIDISYNSHAPVDLVRNIFHKTRESLRHRYERTQEQKWDARAELERRFPRFTERLHNRTNFARKVLVEDYAIKPDNMAYDIVIKADAIWYKYTTGYYSFIYENMLDAVANGYPLVPTTQEALQDMRYALADLKRIVMNQQYTQAFNATIETTRFVARGVVSMLDEGIIEVVTRTYRSWSEKRRTVFSRASHDKARLFEESLYSSPLYQWWNAPKSEERGMAPFIRHMSNVIDFQRTHWQTESFNFFNADLKFWSVADVIRSRFSKPEWTPEQLQHLEKLKRVYYQVYNRIWPGHLSKEIQERFLFNANCVLADRALDVTIKVIDYCGNEASANLNITSKYFDSVSRFREDTYYGYKNRHRFIETHAVPGDNTSYIRPRLIIPNATEYKSHKVDYRVYRRGSLANKEHGPAGFNLYYWLVAMAEDFTGYGITAQTDTWYAAVRDWIRNPNTDIQHYPVVGLAYAIRFSFTCHFPESLNCSIGAGLEQSLLWVTIGFIVLFLIAGYALPILLVPFSFVGLGISYWIVLSAVAWHFPIACLILSPSFPIPLGITLPHCLMDQVMALADKWITNCYSPLIIPAYMIAGEVCPTDPTQAIDFLNCADVGVSDGIQNLLYLGFWLLGQGFCDFMLNLSATLMGFVFPGLQNYMQLTLNSFKTASETNKKRMTFCFFATLPTLLLPAIVLLIGGMLLAAIVPQLLLLGNALIQLLFASPVAMALPGGEAAEETWFGQANYPERPKTRRRGEEEEEEEEEDAPMSLSSWLRGVVYGDKKLGKRKME